MTNIFFFHGSLGHPDDEWIRRAAAGLNQEVYTPLFPTPNNQSLGRWKHELRRYDHLIGEDTILVGRDTGFALILNLLMRKKVRAVIGVDAVGYKINHPLLDLLNDTFLDFDWSKVILTKTILVQLRDGYVGFDLTKQLADVLRGEIVFCDDDLAGVLKEELFKLLS